MNKDKSSDSVLAAHGGPRSVTDSVSPWPVTSEEIFNSILGVVKSGQWGKYQGDATALLEEKIIQTFGCSEVLLASSGTIAVELALRGVGVKPGDEVILAGYDFPGNFRAVEAIGATPVLVDVAAGTWVPDATRVGTGVSEKTRAVLISHLHGQLIDVPQVRRRLDDVSDHRIMIVEDSCQVPGAIMGEQKCGAMGDVGVLSFGGSKLLSAGRGGAVLSSDASVLQRARVWASRGNDAFPLSQLQAAALLPQFETLDELGAQRCRAAGELIDSVSALDDQLIAAGTHVSGSAWYKVPFLLGPGLDRDVAIELMKAEGVPIDIGFRGFARRSARRCRKVDELPNSIVAADRTLLLHHPALLDSVQTRCQIFAGIKKVMDYLDDIR